MSFLAYFPYFERKMKVGLRDFSAVRVSVNPPYNY
jgi:hypothetical protein